MIKVNHCQSPAPTFMKAIFSPGPSYSDHEVRKVAGWVKILDLYKEALDELGYDVFIPNVPREFIDQASTVSKILSYDVVAASQIPENGNFDLFLGPPGYSLAQMMKLKGSKLLIYVWNNADFYRDKQLAEEYGKFGLPYDLSPTWRWINRTAVNLADLVIACSPWVKKTWSEVVPAEKIVLNPWGVDSARFTPAAKEPDVFRILFVGGDPVRKGLIYLLKALEGERDLALRPYELWIVGCAPLKYAPAHWKQFGMVPNEQMPEIYRQCSVLVCPTLEDGIALCVQEAMVSGVVPIGTPEVAEVFEEGVSGFTVGYRSPEDIFLALLRLRENKDLCQGMREAAIAKAREQDWEKTKASLKDLIRYEMM